MSCNRPSGAGASTWSSAGALFCVAENQEVVLHGHRRRQEVSALSDVGWDPGADRCLVRRWCGRQSTILTHTLSIAHSRYFSQPLRRWAVEIGPRQAAFDSPSPSSPSRASGRSPCTCARGRGAPAFRSPPARARTRAYPLISSCAADLGLVRRRQEESEATELRGRSRDNSRGMSFPTMLALISIQCTGPCLRTETRVPDASVT
jgi:hypothetical protein